MRHGRMGCRTAGHGVGRGHYIELRRQVNQFAQQASLGADADSAEGCLDHGGKDGSVG